MAATYALFDTTDPRSNRISFYQNQAQSLVPGGNCMILHYPGDNLELVRGPEMTTRLMSDMTSMLPSIVPTFQFRGGGGVAKGMTRVETYGDYDIVISERASVMLEALDQVSPARRPEVTNALKALLGWYQVHYSDHSFVLACFNGGANPTHPIVVEYVPLNDDIIVVPGLDCHTGEIPVVGALIERSIRVAFGVAESSQPFEVNYRDGCGEERWAPKNVTGFFDNRSSAPNMDYGIAVVDASHGFAGRELLDLCF